MSAVAARAISSDIACENPSPAIAVRQYADVRARAKEGLRLNREIDGLNRRGRQARAGRIEKLQAHHAALPVDSRDAFAVVAGGADRAGDVGAVPVIVARIAGERDP